MSKIALSGNASGTGTLTIAAPNTNSDATINLPTVTGGSFVVSNASGNVGIGTDSPIVPLQVAGTIRSTGTDANAGVQATTGSATLAVISNARTWSIQSSNGDSALRFRDETSGAERARIDSSGNFAFNSGYGSVATAYGCRAWVNFNGTGTVAIRGSGNVSSVSDNGTGLYTVNFTTAMPDSNYCFEVFSQEVVGSPGSTYTLNNTTGTWNTSQLQVATFSSSAYQDHAIVNVTIFR